MDWKKELIKATKQIGTYRPAFDPAIDILADLLTKRDAAQKFYDESGEPPIVELTNKSVATHPAIKLVMECEASALPYLKEMGLTANGLNRISDEKDEKAPSCQLEDLRSRFKVG